ncbi:MAG: CYTH domain-containing protein, partial [Proteobacteria bacterium]|nr:CYTH domain-containing protein [Pseudomonadota bacterium]
MSLEQEIKLQVVNDNIIDLAAIEWLKPYWQSILLTQQLVSTYFDTPDLYLIKHGVGLR